MADQPTGAVTMLFTDIEGSTRLLDRLGADRYAAALDLHRQLLREAFARHGGYEVDYEGDAFFVAFASANAAVSAAAEAQEALSAAQWPEEGEIRVRIGLHTGEPVATPPKYVGLDVHKAARVMAAGHGGQVLLSEATRRLVDAEVLPLGEHRLKDLLQPEPLYQLVVPGLRSEFPALKSLGNRPTNLPLQTSPLIGREHETAQVIGLLRKSDMRLLTLTGPGGTGKTRLMLHVAAELSDEFASGVFLVALAAIREPARVIPAIAQALALRELPGEELFETLASYLEQKHMLLVLDNFEQVMDAAVDVAALLDRCEAIKVLVTSRERLRLRTETVYEVPALTVPDRAADAKAVLANEAGALFVARATAAAASFALSRENAPVIAAICERLEGLPLAIELAAARMVSLTPEALLRRLEQRLSVLTTGPRDVDSRQRTLRKTIDWSYDLLTEGERSFFAELGIFSGGGRLEAVEAICAEGSSDGLDLLDSLVAKSLVVQSSDVDGEPRFGMLDTLREYALERLGERRDRFARSHARYYGSKVAAVREELESWDLPRAAELLDADEANIRAAFDHLIAARDGDAALRLANSLLLYWYIRGRPSEAIAQLRVALAQGARDGRQRVRALNNVALAMAMGRADSREIATAADEAEKAAFELADECEVAFALNNRALAEAFVNAHAALELLEEASMRAERANAPWVASMALLNLGWVQLLVGDRESARETLIQVQDVCAARRINPPMYAMAAENLGMLALEEQRYADAIGHFEQSIVFAREIGLVEIVAASLEGLVATLVRQQRHEDAALIAGAADRARSANEVTRLQEYEHQIAEQSRATLRAALGDERFHKLRLTGSHLTIEESITRARATEPLP
ncbi:MAG: adenylate/guanylate cyclase domain-containing protein [Gaiellaceae bacterium]